MGTDHGQESRPDSGNPVQGVEAAEDPAGFPVGDDSLREAHPDARQTSQLHRRRAIGIEPLIGAEGAGERQDAVSMRGRGGGRKGGEELHLARGFAGPVGQPADALAHQAE